MSSGDKRPDWWGTSGDFGESYGDEFPLDNLNKWLSYVTTDS